MTDEAGGSCYRHHLFRHISAYISPDSADNWSVSLFAAENPGEPQNEKAYLTKSGVRYAAKPVPRDNLLQTPYTQASAIDLSEIVDRLLKSDGTQSPGRLL